LGEFIASKKKKKKKKPLFRRMLEKLASYVWRILRDEFSKLDKSKDILTGIDVTDYFGPQVIELSTILPIGETIGNIYNQIDNVVLVGIERKGFSLLGGMLDEIDRGDINILRNRSLTKELIKGKNVILFDDASHTGNTIIGEVEKLKKLGAREILAFVILITDNALEEIHKNKIEIFYRILCKEEEYSILYSSFYSIVNSSVIPVTGEPLATIKFDQKDMNIIPYILSKLRHGDLYIIDSYDKSSPIRASIDYFDYVNNGGHTIFKKVGDITGMFITLDQVKVRMFFSYKYDKIVIKLKPIIYFELPEDVDCKNIEECTTKFGKSPSSEECRDCIEKMLSNILIDDLKNEIDRLR